MNPQPLVGIFLCHNVKELRGAINVLSFSNLNVAGNIHNAYTTKQFRVIIANVPSNIQNYLMTVF